MAHSGGCFCGAVKLAVTETPEAMGSCHCQSRRSWSAAPVTAVTLRKPSAIRISAGIEHVAIFQKVERTQLGGSGETIRE